MTYKTKHALTRKTHFLIALDLLEPLGVKCQNIFYFIAKLLKQVKPRMKSVFNKGYSNMFSVQPVLTVFCLIEIVAALFQKFQDLF